MHKMQVIYKKRFLKHYKKLPSKLQIKVKDTLALFMSSPMDDSLNNHALSGEFFGCRSLDVTGDYRIIFADI
jgi:addiction module RelE/StbE family toxin